MFKDNILEDGLCSAFRSSLLENRDVPCTERDIDFSDFYLQPPPDLTEVVLCRFQEEQDEELARLLQEQESKRSPYKNMNDQQMAIEEQDCELAKVFEEKEQSVLEELKNKRDRSCSCSNNKWFAGPPIYFS
ncbi:uncharacterized protein LOC143239510 isoform X2 [Tachypleus tridentatus]|uniref:uncharacterized protein LOC143239510 isoform X2 n=1 Tax=Tachypleus tridentatus TaxID=6853 RepID=UPI003FD5305F